MLTRTREPPFGPPLAHGEYAQVRMKLPGGAHLGPDDGPDLLSLATSPNAPTRSDALILAFVKLEYVLRSRGMAQESLAKSLSAAIRDRSIDYDDKLWQALRQRNAYAHQGIRPNELAATEAVQAIARAIKQLLVACSTDGCPNTAMFRCELCTGVPRLYCGSCFTTAGAAECVGCLAVMCGVCLNAARDRVAKAVASQPHGLWLQSYHRGKLLPPDLHIPEVAWACDTCRSGACRRCAPTKELEPHLDESFSPEGPHSLESMQCGDCLPWEPDAPISDSDEWSP